MASTRTLKIGASGATTIAPRRSGGGEKGKRGGPGVAGVAGSTGPTGGTGPSSIVTEANSTRTAGLSDNNTELLCTNTAGCSITIPPQSSVAWASGTVIYARQGTTNQVQFVAGSGVTINSADTLKSRAQYSQIGIFRTASDNWTVLGDTEYDIAALSVQANAANSTLPPSAVASTADGQRFRRENNALVWEGEWATDTGSANALAATISNSGTFTLQDGALYGVRAANANTNTVPTLALNGGTARTITKFGNQALAPGDIYGAGHECLFRYVSSTPRFELLNPAASGGGASTKIISQASHGFAVGNVVYLSGASTYAKATANNSANAEVVGIVTTVIDTNTFILTTIGYVTGLSGLTAGSVYFLDPTTAGAMTATEPSGLGQISKPLFVADTTTSGYFFNWRGEIVGSGANGIPAGNAFPANPTTGFRFFRTDKGLDCYYDGTRWLTVHEYHGTFTSSNNTGAITAGTGNWDARGMYMTMEGTYDWYVTRWVSLLAWVSGTMNGTSYWSVTLDWGTTALSYTNLASFNNSSPGTINQIFRNTATVNQVVSHTSAAILRNFLQVGAGTPGVVYFDAHLYYRLVVT